MKAKWMTQAWRFFTPHRSIEQRTYSSPEELPQDETKVSTCFTLRLQEQEPQTREQTQHKSQYGDRLLDGNSFKDNSCFRSEQVAAPVCAVAMETSMFTCVIEKWGEGERDPFIGNHHTDADFET
ncbi:hypothetical protein XENORESO_017273 [Xenotaenia resolanae]|uniref:Uncharacterized protein n=1 Tax=Xenotaenia resolanae TaxID=208358 RepID=A0ABV0X334_9TELE